MRRGPAALSKQKELISARSVLTYTPTDGSLKVSFYHRQSVNAVLLTISFYLPSDCFSRRSPIHVGSLEEFFYHQQNVNVVLLSISFPLPTWTIVGKLVLRGSLVFTVYALYFFSLHITSLQADIFIFTSQLVCEMTADVSAAGTYSCFLP